MAIVSGAVLAVTAAVASVSAVGITAASVAAIAAAVVAVSTVVAVAGLAVTAVGMVTKNEDLLGVGKIMGYAGLAGGIAGGIVGSVAIGPSAFAAKVSSLYSAAPARASAAVPAATSNVAQAAPSWGSFATQVPGSGVLQTAGQVAPWQAATEVAKAGTGVLSPDLLAAGASLNKGMVTGLQPPVASSAGTTPPQAPTAPTSTAEAGQRQLIDSASRAPVQNPPGSPDFSSMTDGASWTSGVNKPAPTQGLMDWFNGLPPAMQASMAMMGGQGIAGAMGGLFEGRSAQERMDFEREINNRYTQNMSSSPLIQFAPRPARGILNTVGGTA